MIFSGLENIRKEKRGNQKVVSLLFGSLNRPKMDLSLSGVPDVLVDFFQNTSGQKITKFVSAVNTSNEVKLVEYLDGFQYTGGELNFFPTSEGYVKATPTGLVPPGTPPSAYAFNYVFNYTDHLGNVRVSYTKDPQTGNLKILDESHYYPFGLKHQEYSTFGFVSNPIQGVIIAPVVNNPYKYKFNGKEWQDELNLNMYSMDMRMYDPAIARWVVLDPVTHFEFSPYNAFDNNPVFWADPSGADAVNIGYDREIDSNSFSGSATWSGGFQEIWDNGKDNSNNANSFTVTNNDNGGPENGGKGKNNNSSENKNKGTDIAGAASDAIGDYGGNKLKDGSYKQTNGEIGNFNDRPEGRLSENAKFHKNQATKISKLKLLGAMGNIYSFGDGMYRDFSSFSNGEPTIENTTISFGSILYGMWGGALGGATASSYTCNPWTIGIATFAGSIIGAFVGEETVKGIFNMGYDGEPILHKR